MALKISCPECGKQLQFSVEHAGRRAKCSGCGQTIRLPSREAIEAHTAKAAAAEPAAPPPAPVTPAAPEPAPSWDDEFNLDEPLAGGAAPTDGGIDSNPFASPAAADSTAPNEPQTGLVYAGFGARWAAAIIDNLILVVLSVGIGFALGAAAELAGQGAAVDDGAIGMIAQLLSFTVQFAYFAGMESSASGATLGKKAMGIRVVSTNGQRIGFGRAVGRYFGKFLSSITLMVGYLMAAFTERKQALHDMLAGTLVVKA